MATTHYIPSNTGWSGSGSPGNSGYIRFKIDQEYNAGSNSSTLTVTLQAKRNTNYALSYGSDTGSIKIGSGSAVSTQGLWVNLSGSDWVSFTNGSSGAVKTWTYTVQHDSTTGAATVPFSLSAVNINNTYGGQTYNIRFPGGTVNLSLSAPRTAPTIGTPAASVVDQTGNFPGTYIAGYSKVKLAVAVTKGSGNISSVTASYPGGSSFALAYNSTSGKYEGTSAGVITGNTTFTITATASDGMTASKTVSVTGVVPYTTPTITIDETYTYRCDSSGTKTDGGTYYRVKATANYYSGLSGNSITTFNVKIKGSSTATNLTSGTQSGAISGMTDSKLRYTIVLTVQDRVSGAVTREYNLNGMMRDLVMKRSSRGTQVGVGTTPTYSSNAPSLIDLPSGGIVLIGSIGITDSSTSPGTYLPGTWTAISQSAIPGLYFWLRS